jgi:hypothetical protein
MHAPMERSHKCDDGCMNRGFGAVSGHTAGSCAYGDDDGDE